MGTAVAADGGGAFVAGCTAGGMDGNAYVEAMGQANAFAERYGADGRRR